MPVKGSVFGSCSLYLSFGTCYDVNIMQFCCSCVLLLFMNRICKITTPERFCTVYEKCKFLSMGYISALTQVCQYEARMFICDLKLQQKTPIIYSLVWFVRESLVCEEFALHVGICNLG